MRVHSRTDDKKVPYFDTSVSVDAEVEISPRELHEAGWHHESECGGTSPELATPLVVGGVSEREAIASLHRQAHPHAPGDPGMCPEEPCRSLSFDQVTVRIGRPA